MVTRRRRRISFPTGEPVRLKLNPQSASLEVSAMIGPIVILSSIALPTLLAVCGSKIVVGNCPNAALTCGARDPEARSLAAPATTRSGGKTMSASHPQRQTAATNKGGSPSFLRLLIPHAELDELFYRHQEALLSLDLPRAMERLQAFENRCAST
jgi:hypothetical protein